MIQRGDTNKTAHDEATYKNEDVRELPESTAPEPLSRATAHERPVEYDEFEFQRRLFFGR